jgi:hypothetical protein
MNNPFHSGAGAVPTEKFGGRESLIADFLSATRDRNSEEPASFFWVIAGNRGYGKSSFAQWISEEAEAHNAVASNKKKVLLSIDLQKDFNPKDVVDSDYLFRKINERLLRLLWDLQLRSNIDRLKDWINSEVGSVTVGGITIDPRNTAMTARAFFEIITAVFEKLKDKVQSVVFVFDEVSSRKKDSVLACMHVSQTLCDLVETRKWAPELQMPTLGIILLPLPGWSGDLEITEDQRRHMSKENQLDEFTPVESVALLNKLFEKSRLQRESSFDTSLQQMSGGVPHLFQRIGHEAVRIHKSAALTEADIQEAVRTAEGRLQQVLTSVLKYAGLYPLDDESKYVLRAFATFQEYPCIKSESEWLSELASKIGLSRNMQVVTRIWESLKATGLVIRDPQDRMKWRFLSEAVRIRLDDIVK